MKILLVFPPVWEDPIQPYTSLPCLTGHLRARGLEVIPLDLNIHYFHYFFQTERLARMVEAIAEIRAAGERDAAVAGRWGGDFRVLELPEFAGRAARALQTLRDPEAFYDYREYSTAMAWMQFATGTLQNFHWSGGESLLGKGWEDAPQAGPQGEEPPPPRLRDPGYRRFLEEHFLARVRAEKPDLVGLSCINSSQLFHGLELGYLLKREPREGRPHVVAGGTQFTVRAGNLHGFPELFRCLDSVVLNEGETALLRLGEALAEGREGDGLRGIPNLVLPGGEGNPEPPAAILAEDLNALATPDYRGLPLDLYLSPRTVAYLQSSRGCYWSRCTYCSIQALQKSYRVRRVELLLGDMEKLAGQCGTDLFYFTDEVVSVPTLRRLAQGLIERGSPYRWICETRFEKQFDGELCRLLRRAGCRKLMFGLESASERVLGLMRKGLALETASRILEECRAADLAVSVFAIVGFPTETEAEAVETLRYVFSRQALLDRPGLTVYFTPFKLLQGSDVSRHPERYGLVVKTPVRSQPGPEAPQASWQETLFSGFFPDYESPSGPPPEAVRQMSAAFDRHLRAAYDYLLDFVEPHEFLYLNRWEGDLRQEFPHRVSYRFIQQLSERNLLALRPRLDARGVLRPDGEGRQLINLRARESLRLEPLAARVLEQCDGRRTIGEILGAVAGPGTGAGNETETGAPVQEERDRLRSAALRQLAELLGSGMVEIILQGRG